ncbi:MAG: hypothetical protein KKI08_11055 [Armatimonadetes bacterium]|nr:hypothetical protein [Armatimonadota bacterium]
MKAEDCATALNEVLGDCRWEAAALAAGYCVLDAQGDPEIAARTIYDRCNHTLSKSRDLVQQMQCGSFEELLKPREKRGSAENPITKMFPAAITERRFLDLLDDLHAARPSVTYTDDRGARGLSDFTLVEGGDEVPINIKNAGTRFQHSLQLVGLEPDDCIPIPAYKAHDAVAKTPNLLYAVAADYELMGRLDEALPSLFTPSEVTVWRVLNEYTGAGVRDAEDRFVYGVVKKHWDSLRALATSSAFNVVSARKAIRILQTKPLRTPGIGLRAWGTGASAEVNVHLSVGEDMTPWISVGERVLANGLADIVEAVNRKRQEWVYDPEI